MALAAALLAETFVATNEAYAAPGDPALAQEEAALRGPDGVLQASDSATAATIARLEGERVEIVGERTETSSTWALPNGTFAAGLASGPIWVRRGDGDGTSAADWAAVDLTLEQTSDGTVRPKAHPAGLELAGEGAPEDGLLVSVRGPEEQTVGLQWAGALPRPRLEGPRAVYPAVRPGVDLVVEATRTGYEQFFVLTDRPAAGDAPELSLTMTTDGLTATPDADGGVAFTEPDGTVVGSTGTPLAWDAAVDGERQHPLTEPWSAEGEAPGAFAPFPADWGTEPPRDEPAAEPAPQPDDTPSPSSPTGAGVAEPGEDAGRPVSEEATAAGATPLLPLTEAVEVTAPGTVELTLTPDAAFLAHPDTAFPVVVDPEFQAGGLFDTWVQTGYNTDQSGSTELKLGTYDGGANVARTFINEDLTGLRGKQILGATLELYEWHSSSCVQTPWEVWDTGVAGTGTRINAQPVWYSRWAVSTQTKGYSGACGAGYVYADVTNLFQSWVNYNAGLVTMGLKAGNESDTKGWKRFNSVNAGAGIPIVYINYNTQPGAPDMLRMDPEPSPLVASTSSATPLMIARAHDADGATFLKFRVTNVTKSTTVDLLTPTSAPIASGQMGQMRVPQGFLAHGDTFRWAVWGWDGSWAGPSSGSVDWTVDTSAPAAPTVGSTDYPADGTWHGAENQSGTVTLTLPAADPTLAAFVYDLDKTPGTRLNVAAGAVSTTIPVAPTTPGRHVLQVKSVDRAGNASPIVSYVFHVGKGALTSPLEGAQVARRVRLTVDAEPELTYAKFQWRRGPDAGDGIDLSLATLSRADGTGLAGAWTPLADLGGYATWDAGSTLGFSAGPAQVRALLSGDAQGSSPFATPWVTVTVNPDAASAATDSVGPGSVNLLTGDFRLSSTDVDEFGLAIGRTASSRDPKAGREPQQELLSAAQQTISAPLTGYWPSSAVLERATDRWHGSNDSLKIISTHGTTESFAYPGAANTGAIGMQPGRTYRISGWVYVPAANGLQDGSPNAPRIVAYSRAPNGSYPGVPSNTAKKSDSWQQLSLDYTVPADHTAPFIRLYNGFAAANAAVYYDDLSIREIWAPFGPQWSLGVADSVTGTAYTAVSQPYPDVAVVHLGDGGEIWFTGGGGNWWPQPGAEGLRLSITGPGTWRLTELDGTVSDFAVQPNASVAQLVSTSAPAAAGQTRLVYQVTNGQSRLSRMIAPVEPGVDDWPHNTTACTTATPAAGCEVLELAYAATTTAISATVGDYAGQVSEVRLLSLPSAAATTTDAVTAVRYAYDEQGRLREVWDPRIAPALKTAYTYDTDGRVVQLAPPGELPWTFRYGTGGSAATVGGTDIIDRSSGRLLSVSRASLLPGTVDQTGPDTTSTVVYAVPLTRADGGPHDLDAAAIAGWAQRTAPTDATAIFGPEDVPPVTTATATSPGPTGYQPAIVHYLDSSGREVNTATPAGPDAPAAGFIDTAEHDSYGNVVRSLDATNRLLALGQLPTAAADLAALNLTQADTATRAVALSSESTYGPEGLDLLRSRGPLLRLAIGNNPDDVRLVHDLATYAYDEGKPDGVAYHLPTTQTTALLIAGTAPEQLADVVVTTTGYDPINGASTIGPTSGWKVRKPTVVTADAGPGGANLATRVRYDGQGRVVESRGIGSTGTDAGTTRTVYYTADPNPDRPACGGKPGYAGMPCMTYAAGPATGFDSARMAAQLPVKTITAYNRYGSVAAVTESATGPVAGATVTQTRTTTTTYDDADRATSMVITADGAGTTPAPMAKTVNAYDPATGRITTVSAVDQVSGTVLSTVKKTFDRLGRMTRYEDANRGWTASTFDAYGKPTQVNDSVGTTTTFTYDRAIEPRGFVTSVQDSVAGTISAAYGPDGQVTSQTLPGGVTLRIGYDANRNPVKRRYERTSDAVEIATSSVVENGAGQWITHTTPAATRLYSYDRLQRLTGVQDNVIGIGTCTWRKYDYNDRAGRTATSTTASPTTTCADPADPASPSVTRVGYSYDSADRLVTESIVDAGAWVYDPLGRITIAPVRGSPGATVANAYWANDLIASQTIDGIARRNWTPDPLGRFASSTSETWANGAWQPAVTEVNHYDSDSDSPAWIAEDASLPDEISRYVDGLDGSMAMQTGKTGGRVLQLIDLHGDVMTTLPIQDGQTVADWPALKHSAADEFGNPTDLTTGTVKASTGAEPGKDGRYGWLGGKQRSASALAGVLLMGVRLYDPSTGRFWTVDPIPGGNATAYDYCGGDPVNKSDLSGKFMYTLNFDLGSSSLTPTAYMTKVAANFGQVFPIAGRPTKLPGVGTNVDLRAGPGAVIPFPVYVSRRSSDGWAFGTRPGHPDYGGWIAFKFTKSRSGRMNLRITAYVPDYSMGAFPISPAAWLYRKRIYRAVATSQWGQLASNLRRKGW